MSKYYSAILLLSGVLLYLLYSPSNINNQNTQYLKSDIEQKEVATINTLDKQEIAIITNANGSTTNTVAKTIIQPQTATDVASVTAKITTKVDINKIVTKTITEVNPKQLSIATTSTASTTIVSTSSAPDTANVKKAGVTCSPVPAGIESQIESSINKVRLNHGLNAVVACKELRNAAFAKYKDIVLQNNFTHSWAGGQLLQNVIRSYGYMPKDWGEILVEGSDFTTGDDYVNEWMSSPSHAAIILTPKYTHVGVAVGAWTDEGVAVSIGVAEFGEAK